MRKIEQKLDDMHLDSPILIIRRSEVSDTVNDL